MWQEIGNIGSGPPHYLVWAFHKILIIIIYDYYYFDLFLKLEMFFMFYLACQRRSHANNLSHGEGSLRPGRLCGGGGDE